ncbi:MAG TPA: nuclear transport factor 2 family protein [Bryobacteraceae bacterium]|jgi:hypothetical protein|nr:nuclear transport factor 2 family protein [Bryobacteraceae bacterium]
MKYIMKLFRGMALLLAMAIAPFIAFAQPKIEAPSLKNTILENETATWEQLKQKNYSAFGELLADNYAGIDNTGISNRAELLKALPDLHLVGYSIDDVKVMQVASGVALITYKVKLDGSYQGKNFKRPIYAASVWVKRGSKWLQTFNQETEAQ